MASESDKKPEIDNPTGEIDKNVKRSGVFDKIKKDALDELQEMNEIKVSKDYMLNLVRINFDKQSKERKYPPKINERRIMLKNMISNASMFQSLENSILNSPVFKSGTEKLMQEVDRLIPQYYPNLVFNSTTKQWEPMRDDTGTLPNTETSAIPSTPSYSDYFAQLSSHAPHHSEYNEQLDVDMDLDSSSTTSSVDNSKELSGLSSNTMHLDIDLPPPPPPPSF